MHTYIVKDFEDWKARYGLIDAKATQGNVSTRGIGGRLVFSVIYINRKFPLRFGKRNV